MYIELLNFIYTIENINEVYDYLETIDNIINTKKENFLFINNKTDHIVFFFHDRKFQFLLFIGIYLCWRNFYIINFFYLWF
jgi:hypothetical protein